MCVCVCVSSSNITLSWNKALEIAEIDECVCETQTLNWWSLNGLEIQNAPRKRITFERRSLQQVFVKEMMKNGVWINVQPTNPYLILFFYPRSENSHLSYEHSIPTCYKNQLHWHEIQVFLFSVFLALFLSYLLIIFLLIPISNLFSFFYFILFFISFLLSWSPWWCIK